ncbi:bifunctional enoyl-CoA hydratase/phosphate acetyltransferase [Bosea sp. (in: a-proteobacteria)]|uniref:bifunctional enoyl-CoA hydratase/phosphate acetyltransferase n=1 Tax=Bosea sp. (in: a-proteobacteria) TaxID=1871050 RepID=UPI002610EE09|nr:bifunctional enoyl-CoA hydratase/phosphate acetyltransferase [Bosea sp. (in: a-proteobacteria)]MCO5091193.1 bifunctional enoyl-CoA hydratase/phosphate acetyltransferase [Bosea sp. (in: a-proteobacteria)]
MDQELLTNRTFDEIAVGESASLSRIVRGDDVALFAAVSGDANPAHLDATFAMGDPGGPVVAHGMWIAALVAAVLGTKLPGPGTIYRGQDLRFLKPVVPGDAVTATVTVRSKEASKRTVVLDTACTNQRGETVLSGMATVTAPERRLTWPRLRLAEAAPRHSDRYRDIVARACALPPLSAAIVHPCSPDAIRAAIEVRDEGLLQPILVGPEAKIRAAAEKAGVALDGIPIETAPHSHAAAARAVELAVAGRVGTLIKGSLHTDELLGAVVAPGSGLKTERRISHVYAMSLPAYPKPLIVTDAAVNIQPTLMHKRDICQNAIDMLHVLGLAEPLVAVLAAVETVSDRMPSTLDAAALTVMAARGQITGARVDGPLAFDNAISPEAARTKEIVSPVAGQADILLVPDLEAGNMLAKQLIYFANADAAGLVLGARVPIVLTSRADSLKTRIASAALAKLVAADRQPLTVPA